MNLRWRRVYYSSAIIIFLIAAPLLLLYAFGYRVNWREREIRQTGAIAISTSPRGATVWLNGLELNKSTPIRITNLTPGQYDLVISKPNYRSWQQKLVVSPSQSTNLKNLVLFKAEATTTEIWSGPKGLTSLSPDGDWLAVVSPSNSFAQLSVIDTTNKHRITAPLPSNAEYGSIDWSNDGKNILLSCSTTHPGCFYIYRPADLGLINLSKITGQPINQAWWSREQSDLIFAATPDQLVLVDLYNQQATPIWAGQVGDFLPYKTGGFFTDQTNQPTRLMAYDPTIGSPEPIAVLTGSTNRFWPGPADYFALEDTATHQFTLNQAPDGRRLFQIPLDRPGQFIAWDRIGLSLLLGDGHELYTYHLETDRYHLITRQIEPYQTADWFPVGSAVIIIDRGRLQATNLVNGEPTGYQNLYSQSGLRLLGFNRTGSRTFLEWTENEKTVVGAVALQ